MRAACLKWISCNKVRANKLLFGRVLVCGGDRRLKRTDGQTRWDMNLSDVQTKRPWKKKPASSGAQYRDHEIKTPREFLKVAGDNMKVPHREYDNELDPR